MELTVSISIPLYKCEVFLERCLQSVRAQTYYNFEVSLINDQTPDNSVELAEKFIEKFELTNWKIFHLEENSGLSVVRNKGIDLARGKYLFFLDSDDEISPDCIEILVWEAEKTQAEMTIAQIECETQDTGKTSLCLGQLRDDQSIEGNNNVLKAFAEGRIPSSAVNKLFVVDYLKKNKLYFVPGLFAQDELWTFHLCLKLNKVAFQPKKVTYTYYLHSKSVIHNRNKRNFDNWFTIAQYIDAALKQEINAGRKILILKYLVDFKNMTLLMNWKAQQNEVLWKESYDNYKKLSSLKTIDYFSLKFPLAVKKTDLFTSLPTNLGFKFFKWRFNR